MKSKHCTLNITHFTLNTKQCIASKHCTFTLQTQNFTLQTIQFMPSVSENLSKNPAYGKHQVSRPMRIIGPIQI